MAITKMFPRTIIVGTKTCARFNRDDPCLDGKWHTSYPKKIRIPGTPIFYVTKDLESSWNLEEY
jgi:hypothetical protein